MQTKILIVDDDPFICRQLEDLYTAHQYESHSASNAGDALRMLGEQEFSLVICDLKIPGTDGLGLTREIRDRWPDLDVVMITGYASIKGAVEAIKQGASEYISSRSTPCGDARPPGKKPLGHRAVSSTDLARQRIGPSRRI